MNRFGALAAATLLLFTNWGRTAGAAYQVEVNFDCERHGDFELWWTSGPAGSEKVVARFDAVDQTHVEKTWTDESFEFREAGTGVVLGRTSVKAPGRVKLGKSQGLIEEWQEEAPESNFDRSIKTHLQQYKHKYSQLGFKLKASEWEHACRAEFPTCDHRFCNPYFDDFVYALGQIVIPRQDWQFEMDRMQPGRHQLIATQPAKLPRFTVDGYSLREWPADKQDLLDKVLAQVEKSKNQATPGGYDMFNPYVSAWESNVWVYNIGSDLNNKLIEMLKTMLEEWSGEKLMYSLYHGPRIYRKGAVLNMHVDVFQTHVISAIIHLGHKDVTTHWPLEVVDFDGNVQHVSTDRPGQIVLYESAKVLHGRPTPFDGTEYINMFFHFRPVGWKDPQQWLRELRKKKPDGWAENWEPTAEL